MFFYQESNTNGKNKHSLFSTFTNNKKTSIKKNISFHVKMLLTFSTFLVPDLECLQLQNLLHEHSCSKSS